MEIAGSYEVSVVDDPFGPIIFGPKLVHFVEVVRAQFLRKFPFCSVRYVGERAITLKRYLGIYIKNLILISLKVIYLSRRKSSSIDHRYASCRVKQGASAPTVKT